MPPAPPLVTIDKDNAADSGGSVGMLYHGGAKAHPVMRLAETRVVGSLNQLIDRGTVAVCAVRVSPFVEAEAKGVDLTVTPDFDA